MAHRSIGQDCLAFSGQDQKSSSLDDISALIDWQPIAALLGSLYAAPKGEAAWPPLAMFRAMLLAVWYDLSDVKLAEALDDRTSFRRFCGFSAHEPTPERTAFVRFRRELASHSLDQALFEAVTGQLKSRAIRIKTGTIVDATIIASQTERDDEARWVKHKGRKAVHGFKAHVGADATTALVEQIAITPANINDGRAGPDAIPNDPGEVFADSAYRGNHFRDAVRSKGGTLRVAATSMWGRDEQETLAQLKAWNDDVHRTRGRIEKIFGTWKRSYGLRRMRWRGLAKAAIQIHVTAIAYNLRRTLNILAVAA
ncbi:IS5 family transposase [Gluconobacter albidus]|uniref:IS5 family transposase n=1 Tax=Gluconobacter albidus TaxID=318683 RepID=UPI00209DA5FF|nr:IS5 family transposase [Gluconobacter albidus]MCP1275077.1 IS5 family transposase [Gluconobacter albidus]